MSDRRTRRARLSAKAFVLAAIIALSVVSVAAAAAPSTLFHLDQRLSKGWFGVLTYKFVRDEIPGGSAALSECDQSNKFDDLGGESQFKQDALNCLADMGYFDEVPAPSGSPNQGRLFHPDQRLSKGWFGVLTYKFVRDEIRGGRAALSGCGSSDRFSDLSAESSFKRNALNCLAGLGYFDQVPLPDGSLPGWRTAPSSEDPDDSQAINAGQPTTASCDFRDHSSRAVSAVYQVRTSQGIGTAFYIGNNEWLTAAHVIEGETTVALHNGDARIQATVTAGDSVTDVALLSAPPAATTLRFGVLSGMVAGEAMYAVGFPLYEADSPAVSRGVMSRVETDPRTGTLIVTDAAVNPGNSGGPLLDACGRVHGVVSFKLVAEDVEGIAYAIAVDQDAVNSLRESGTANLTAQETYEECFGSGGDSDWTEGEGGWWHAVWTHRVSGPKIAGIALSASDTGITDYRNELPDGCDDWHAELRVECDASTREFWASTWWSGLTVPSSGGRASTAIVLDDDAPIQAAWASDPGGKYTYVPAESVFSFIQLLPLTDTLQFKGYAESHDDPPVLDATFDLDGADAALDHLTRECGDDPRRSDPNPQLPADPGDWITQQGENAEGSYVVVVVQGRAYGVYDWQDPPLLVIRCGTRGASGNDAAFVITPFFIFNDFTDDRSTVKWRIAPAMSTPVTENDWWSDEDSDSALWASEQSSLASRLAATQTGTLYLTIIPGSTVGNAESMEFNVTGAATVLSSLSCV